MPGKMLSCPHCSKVMHSDNLKNHIKRHGDVQQATSYQPQPGHKRPSSSPNPKIQNIVNEIRNDSEIVEGNSRPIPPIRQESTREKSNISKAIKNPSVPTPQNLPMKLVPPVVDSEYSLEIDEDDPNLLQVVNLQTKKSQPRTKHDSIGSSDDEDDVEEQSSGEANNNDEGLRDQFNQLFVEFTRDKKHEHGLLDEILEPGTITALKYNKLNSIIAIPEKSSDEGTE